MQPVDIAQSIDIVQVFYFIKEHIYGLSFHKNKSN